MYDLEYAEGVADDLDELTARDSTRILDNIDERRSWLDSSRLGNTKRRFGSCAWGNFVYPMTWTRKDGE